MDIGLDARCVLAKMFTIDERDIVFMDSRLKNKMKARRFYIYYLWRYKKIKHYQMKRYIKGIHHASSIHHCRLMEKEIDLYKDIKKEFITFMWYADQVEYEKMKIDQVFSMEDLKDVEIDRAYVECKLN